MMSGRTKNGIFLALGIASLGGIAYMTQLALKSPLFVLDSIEIAESSWVATRAAPIPVSGSVNGPVPAFRNARSLPIDPREIQSRADLEIGESNLFSVDLETLEKKILGYGWLREVRLTKKFPRSLLIEPVARTPVALVQRADGSMSYLDSDGTVFGPVDLEIIADLPVAVFPAALSVDEVSTRSSARLALRFIRAWDEFARPGASLASVEIDTDHHWMLRFVLPSGRMVPVEWGLDLGGTSGSQSLDAELSARMSRLARVLEFLGRKAVAASKIVMNDGKKIVVKTARGS